jgi:hypothetical protein
VALGKGQAKEAADAFAQALPFTAVRPLARVGLGRAVYRLAQTDAGAARTLVAGIPRGDPADPAVVLCDAITLLKEDKVGNPGDGDNAPSMAGALNRWGKLLAREGADPLVAPLTKAEFWLAAGRADAAEAEVARVLAGGRKAEEPPAGNPAQGLDPDALDLVGRVWERVGKPASFTQMRDLFEEARRRFPGDARVLLHLAQAYAGLGQPARAEPLFAQALQAAEAGGTLPAADRREVIDKARAGQKKLKGAGG